MRLADSFQELLCCSFLLLVLCSCSRMGSLSQDAVLPKLILHRLPSGCSSNITPCYGAHPSGTAPAWVPMGSSFLSLPATLQLLSEPAPMWAQHGPCHLQASSTAALWAPPWMSCGDLLPVVHEGNRGIACTSMGLPWAAGNFYSSESQ